jgi:hypothetical protein
MYAAFLVDRCRRYLMPIGLLGVACWAVLAFGPESLQALRSDAMEPLDFTPTLAQAAVKQTKPVLANTTEAVVLANWEFTGGGSNPTVVNDVLAALADVNAADNYAAEASLASNVGPRVGRGGVSYQAASYENSALAEVYNSYVQLLNAANAANGGPNSPLAMDAAAMLVVYNKMVTDVNAGNLAAVLQDAQKGQTVGNKAVVDASPYK